MERLVLVIFYGNINLRECMLRLKSLNVLQILHIYIWKHYDFKFFFIQEFIIPQVLIILVIFRFRLHEQYLFSHAYQHDTWPGCCLARIFLWGYVSLLWLVHILIDSDLAADVRYLKLLLHQTILKGCSMSICAQ